MLPNLGFRAGAARARRGLRPRLDVLLSAAAADEASGRCPTGGPCTGFAAANFGWTAPNACPYHSYPACNTHIPCATAPPCF